MVRGCMLERDACQNRFRPGQVPCVGG